MSYYFFIAGINADTADIDGWTERAERSCERRGLRANAYPYHVNALDRWVWQAKHVRNATRCLRESLMTSDDVVIAAHSNGVAIALGMLRADPAMVVSELHLIAGAAFASYKDNGLNDAIARHQVGKVFLYCSRDDLALKAAQTTRKFLRFVGLGFGSIGLTGPADMSDEADARTRVIWHEGFDHSTYFDDANFRDTMRAITGAMT